MEQPKLAPFKSVVDVSFFTKLSEKKLNDLKLSESKLPIHASYQIPVGSDKTPTINLSGDGFDNVDHDQSLERIPASYTAVGYLTNVNTIESFKSLNKSELIKNEGDTLIQHILDGDVIQDPSLLVSFHMISFSDLKKYMFNYWFAFPSIGVEWTLLGLTTLDYHSQLQITTAIENWQSTVDLRQRAFYLLKRKEGDDGYVVGKLSEYETFFNDSDQKIVGFSDPCTITESNVFGWPIRNLMALLGTIGMKEVSILCHRDHSHVLGATEAPKSALIDVKIDTDLRQSPKTNAKITGWERDSEGRLAPKRSNLNSLLNPHQRADQSVDLNLKLMKWRIAPDLDLDTIQNTSCLLLGAGTLGSYIARGLLGWGVRRITFVDSGTVSFSNPVRQPLYNFQDCLDGGAPKAKRAAEALKEIYPSVQSEGHQIEIPMAGHPLTNEERQKADYDKLLDLIDSHDVIFLLMDSRESRWLPTVMTSALSKLVINVALGFDSSVVMRHGVVSEDAENVPHLGCYFCNDVVAPIDSVSNQTLDQMCTVTRPGVAMNASAAAIELFASVLQHPSKGLAPASENDDFKSSLSEIPHQLRYFLHNFQTMKIWGPSYTCCSACSPTITGLWKEQGWEFVKRALNEPGYVEDVSGLKQVQEEALKLDEMGMSASDEDF